MKHLKILKFLIISALLIAFPCTSFTQEVRDTLVFYFAKGKATLDTTYMDNGARSKEFVKQLKECQSKEGAIIVKVEMFGKASPEGGVNLNSRLSQTRQKSVIEYLRKQIDIPDSVAFYTNLGADWEGFIKEVEKDPKVSCHDKVVEMLRSDSETRLNKLNEAVGSTWYDYVDRNIFPRLRTCRVAYVVALPALIEEDESEKVVVAVENEPLPESKDTIADIQLDTNHVTISPESISYRTFKVKTNAIGLGMGLINVAAEIDVLPHLSVSVPFYYSGGYNYFKSTIKFRGIVLQPQVRYYPWLQNDKNGGFYVDAHFGLGWYNFALNGDYRIQDHQGCTPAFGGGIGIGYVHQFKKNPRWGLEFGLGAGVYDVKYDVFYNEANGPYREYGTHKTWIGLDNVSVGVSYKFDLRKGGKR